MTNPLFSTIRIGRHALRNRLVMAPMTRSRADDAGMPGDLAAAYYAQRAGAGLIISEGVYPAAMGKGYVRTPGIETDGQVAAWKRVTEAVHARGGRIFMQLMLCGRISHPSLLPGGALPVAPSAIKPAGQAWTAEGLKDFVTPRALSVSEIADVVASYGRATRRALEAGFDGVELHGATGYLPEQFLSSGSNRREDQYGGSVENRTRFVLEVLDAMTAEAGGDRVGIKLSPEMGFNDISDAAPQETYTYLVDRLRGFNLAYLHVALFGGKVDYHALLRPRFDGVYLIGGGLDRTSAQAALDSERADAVVFGSAFLANPDLPARFLQGAPLNAPDKSTFYTPGARLYRLSGLERRRECLRQLVMPAIARLQRANHGSHFRAFGLRGAEVTEMVDPFLGVDHAWMSAPTFPPHPHAGLSAISYVFLDSETGLDNRDSLGNRSLIAPGGLHWTAAGRGVVHEEIPAESGKTAHVLQIFVNLPEARQGDTPFALHLSPEEVPVVRLPGARIRVPLGLHRETRSPLAPPTDVSLLDISIEEGAGLSVPVPADRNAFVMPIHGALMIDMQLFDAEEPRLPVFPAQPAAREVTLRAEGGTAKAVLFSGLPLHQPVHWRGPIAMASPAALASAFAAYRRGEFGALNR